ncbi:outer membrane protein OmpA-like peptidoglycan-associated protein [Lewinella aquimaris]|uniref:Outer membrane protein OmpA-like peptidoglycan-associated protein n=1 Tax=Neolewinella aquimaris TaxID=1835722 RepID=A0A840E6Z6_9BACT|nr:OmpA family protein [Neolewinella aquimaris]MBB4077569.1 outer membrane protein OmpA-like peptidoglycan-associated protein [Neolewinella aquimaris]
MKILSLLIFCLCFSLGGVIHAQGTPMPTTDDATSTVQEGEMQAPVNKRDQNSMLEVGISPVYSWLSSDVTSKGGYGAGLHVRKSLDHLFSLRLDALYARSKGDDGRAQSDGNRRFDTDWYSGTAYGVVTLNNFTFKGDIRNVNVYMMAGAGFNFFGNEFQCNRETGNRYGCDGTNRPFAENRNGVVDKSFQTHAAFGTGINFRINPRFNIGVEYQALVPLGKRADIVDGYDASDFRDVQNIAGVSLNFNLGNPERKTEPRYWTNAFTPVKEDIAMINRRVDEATMDDDGDGIVNSIDQENDTPSGVPVDSRGRTLDSDKDGVPDYRDLEPFFPPREGEVVNADGVVTERIDAPLTEGEIQALIDSSLDRFRQDTIFQRNGSTYLPTIYFPLNSAEVKYDDYGMLAGVARVVKGNPNMKVVVRGYTDRTGTTDRNLNLSYRRALNVVDHLVTVHGVNRDQLVLQYRGEDEAIVPLDRSLVNRRVEFLTGINGAQEDPAPEGMEMDRN